jgi:TetR/AcrR family transcriptional repressor of nem operon
MHSMADAGSSRTRLLDAALRVFRQKGYAATTVEDLCHAAGVTKGSFFHHFASKEALALAAIECWNDTTGALFAAAPFSQLDDPRERFLAYIDFRATLVQGDVPEFTCLLGTLVQETYRSHPTLRAACETGIASHVATLVPTIEEARARHAPKADWSAEGLARHTQVVIQGAFVLAKATQDPHAVRDAIAHLRRYVEQLLPAHPVEPSPRAGNRRRNANGHARAGDRRKIPLDRGAARSSVGRADPAPPDPQVDGGRAVTRRRGAFGPGPAPRLV